MVFRAGGILMFTLNAIASYPLNACSADCSDLDGVTSAGPFEYAKRRGAVSFSEQVRSPPSMVLSL
jgi:hypothetical protein